MASSGRRFPPKNKHKQVDLRYHSSKVKFIVHFLEEIDDPKKPFRNELTFSLRSSPLPTGPCSLLLPMQLFLREDNLTGSKYLLYEIAQIA